MLIPQILEEKVQRLILDLRHLLSLEQLSEAFLSILKYLVAEENREVPLYSLLENFAQISKTLRLKEMPWRPQLCSDLLERPDEFRQKSHGRNEC